MGRRIPFYYFVVSMFPQDALAEPAPTFGTPLFGPGEPVCRGMIPFDDDEEDDEAAHT